MDRKGEEEGDSGWVGEEEGGDSGRGRRKMETVGGMGRRGEEEKRVGVGWGCGGDREEMEQRQYIKKEED